MGMFIGLFLFLVLLVCGTFYGVLRFKTLKKRLQQEYEQKTAKTEQQTQAILNHIDAGICTISRDFIIDPFYNNKILDLFGQKEYGQTSIFDNIFYILEGDVKKELKEYLETIFDAPQASEEMLNSINPVSTFTYVFNESGKVIHKKIKTTTVRIFNEINNIQKVMFIFQDISLIDKWKRPSKRDDLESNQKICCFLNNDREVLNSSLRN
jgi:sensor histidine kinase regulating citrate/malate metabolism